MVGGGGVRQLFPSVHSCHRCRSFLSTELCRAYWLCPESEWREHRPGGGRFCRCSMTQMQLLLCSSAVRLGVGWSGCGSHRPRPFWLKIIRKGHLCGWVCPLVLLDMHVAWYGRPGGYQLEVEGDSWCHTASWRSDHLGRQLEGEHVEESIQLTFLLPCIAATEGEAVPYESLRFS